MASLDDRRFGKDELNAAEFPWSVLADRVSENVLTIERKEEIPNGRGGFITRTIKVAATEEWGLPNPKDDDVIIALIQLAREKNGFQENAVNFSRYELIELLRLSHSGPNYDRVDESLRRWKSITIDFKNAWYDKKTDRWKSIVLSIINQVEFTEEGPPGRTVRGAERNILVKWGDVFFASLKAGNLRTIDLDLYFRLNSSMARRIFRYTDKRFYYGPSFSMDLMVFAFEKAGMARVENIGQIKKRLARPLQELETNGFLAPLPPTQRYRKLSKGHWDILLMKAGAGAGVLEPLPLLDETQAQEPLPAAVKALLDFGIDGVGQARDLASRAGDGEQLIDFIEYINDRLKRDPKAYKSKTGFLVSMIRKGDLTIPGSFVPSRVKRAAHHAEIDLRATKEIETAKQASLDRAIRAYRESLDVGQLRLMEEAVASLVPEECRAGPARKMFVRSLVDEEIRKIVLRATPTIAHFDPTEANRTGHS